MRYAAILFGLLVLGAAFAASSGNGEAMIQCAKSCCTGNGGTWDSGDNECSIDSENPNSESYGTCAMSCITSNMGCCGPGLLLAGIAAFAAFRK